MTVLFSRQDVFDLLPYKHLVEAVESAHIGLENGRVVHPERSTAAVPGLDGYGAVAAAGASIGAMVAVVLHALEHGGSVEEVRTALTATLDRLEHTMTATGTAYGSDGRHTDADADHHR